MNRQNLGKGKGKSVPLQAWTGPEGFQEVKVPRFHDNGTQFGGKDVSLKHRPHLPPGNTAGIHFC